MLREHDAWEAHQYLRNLRFIEQHAQEERRRANEPPVVRVIGKAPLSEGALPNWADGAKRKTLARKAAYGLFWGWLIISISPNPGGPGRNEDCSDRGRFIPGCDPPVRRRT
jgi:hypothetical protein